MTDPALPICHRGSARKVDALLLLVVLARLPNAGAEPDPEAWPAAVPASVGVTQLLDGPAFRVGYRLDDEEHEVSLGAGWQGEDRDTGAQFRPDDRIHGRLTYFMHCPWRKGPGVTFAEFPVALPHARPLSLVVAVGIRKGAPNSDGVVYRVPVDGRPVFEQFCDWRGLREFRIDLASYAGKRVVLRLEVDPGPARNTRDDWALWGKADIEAVKVN